MFIIDPLTGEAITVSFEDPAKTLVSTSIVTYTYPYEKVRSSELSMKSSSDLEMEPKQFLPEVERSSLMLKSEKEAEKTEKQPPVVSPSPAQRGQPVWFWRRIPPGEKCEVCGGLAVEYEVKDPISGKLLKRCEACFERLRRVVEKAEWRQVEEKVEGGGSGGEKTAVSSPAIGFETINMKEAAGVKDLKTAPQAEPISSVEVCWLCGKLLPADLKNTTVLKGKHVHLECYLNWKKGRRNEKVEKRQPSLDDMVRLLRVRFPQKFVEVEFLKFAVDNCWSQGDALALLKTLEKDGSIFKTSGGAWVWA